MRSVFLTLLIVAVASSSGWTFIADLPVGIYPGGFYSGGSDLYIVQYEETTSDGIIDMEIVIDSAGNSECREAEHDLSGIQEGDDLYIPFPYPDDYENWDTSAGVTRLSLSGDTLWSVRLDSIQDRVEVSQPVLTCKDGGIFTVLGPDNGDFIWKAYRLSESGEVLMSGEFQMRGGPVIVLSDLMETEDSGFVVCGTTDDLGMNLFMYVIGIDSDGHQLFEIKEDFRFHAASSLIAADDSGDIYIAGYTGYERSDGFFMPPYDSDVFVMKLDPTGKELWRTVFDYPGENRPSAIHVDEDGSVALVIKSFSYEPSDQPGTYSLLLYQH